MARGTRMTSFCPLGILSYAFIATNLGKRPVRVEIRIRVIFTSRGVSETPAAAIPTIDGRPAAVFEKRVTYRSLPVTGLRDSSSVPEHRIRVSSTSSSANVVRLSDWGIERR